MRTALPVFFLLLAALVAGPAHAAMTAHEKAIYEAAKPEKGVNWYVSHYDAEGTDKIGAAFAQKYPGLTVNIVRVTAQVAFQRLAAEIKAGAIQCDVLGSSDPSHFTYLKQRGLLVKYVPENDAGIIEAFRRYDPDGFFHVTFAGGVGIAVNSEKVKPADDPRTWRDLLDTKWKDRLAVGHPGFSGAVGVWALQMKLLYGASYLKGLEAVKPLVGRSINDAPMTITSGERDVALVQYATAARLANRGAPLRIIYPEDGSVLIVGPSGIIKGSPHPNAAKLFMEYLQSIENSDFLSATYREFVRPEAKAPPGLKSLAEIKLVQPTIAQIETGVPEVKEEWRELFGN